MKNDKKIQQEIKMELDQIEVISKHNDLTKRSLELIAKVNAGSYIKTIIDDSKQQIERNKKQREMIINENISIF